MKSTYMKTPDDLDPMSPEQIPITRSIDTGDLPVLALLTTTSQVVMKVMLSTHGLPLPFWQRAAYEAYLRHKSSGDRVEESVAVTLWAFVEFLQKEDADRKKMVVDPEMQELFRTAQAEAGGNHEVTEEIIKAAIESGADDD